MRSWATGGENRYFRPWVLAHDQKIQIPNLFSKKWLRFPWSTSSIVKPPSKRFFDHFEHSYHIWDKWFDLDFAATTAISDQNGDYHMNVNILNINIVRRNWFSRFASYKIYEKFFFKIFSMGLGLRLQLHLIYSTIN